MSRDPGAWLVVDTVTLHGRDGRAQTCLMRVIGEVDLATLAVWADGFERVRVRQPRLIVVDCAAMRFCGAAGLAVLMQTVALSAARGCEVATVGFGDRLLGMCALLWPGPQPRTFPTIPTALGAAEPAPIREPRQVLVEDPRPARLPAPVEGQPGSGSAA